MVQPCRLPRLCPCLTAGLAMGERQYEHSSRVACLRLCIYVYTCSPYVARVTAPHRASSPRCKLSGLLISSGSNEENASFGHPAVETAQGVQGHLLCHVFLLAENASSV